MPSSPPKPPFKKLAILFFFLFQKKNLKKEATNDPKKKSRLKSIKATALDDLIQAANQAREHRIQDRSLSRTRRYLASYRPLQSTIRRAHLSRTVYLTLRMLPRVRLVSVLYSTESLHRMVAILYACIIKFLIRALRWYEEGSLKRALHAVTKPIGLQYDDILEEISRATRNIMAEATAGSQAEQRDMHNELTAIRNAVEVTSGVSSAEQRDQRQMLKELLDLVSGLKTDIHSGHVVAQTERSQIYQSVCDIKSTQALHVLSSQCLIDYEASLQASKSQRDRRRALKSTPFWKSRDLQDWNQSPTSSFFILRVRIADRQSVQDFSTNVIQQLLQAGLASLWILRPRDETHSSIDALKSLIYQAAISVSKLTRENDQTLDINRFLHAHSEKEHVELLADVLCSLKVVYFIIQSSAIESDYIPQFVSCLRKVIQRVAEQGAATILRVLVINWSPGCNFGETESLDDRRSRLQPLRVPKSKKTRTPSRPFLTRRTPSSF